VVHRHRGESAEAERSWRLILDLKRPDQFCSFDQGIYGHLTRRNLAALAAERGDLTEARRLWADVLAECPGDREAVAKRQLRSGTVSWRSHRSDESSRPFDPTREDCTTVARIATHREPAIFTTFVPSSKQGRRGSCNLRGKHREPHVLPSDRRNDFIGCPVRLKRSW
jgi:hypothetical protein